MTIGERMCKNPILSLKLQVDAYAGQILRQNETYILYFLPPPLFQKHFYATGLKVSNVGMFDAEEFAGVCSEN